MARATTALFVLLILTAAGVLLQIFLSRRESKWPGLILPGIGFLFSLVAVLNVAALVSMANTILAVLTVLVLYNIPTVLLLAIYGICRQKYSRDKELEKMNIADL